MFRLLPLPFRFEIHRQTNRRANHTSRHNHASVRSIQVWPLYLALGFTNITPEDIPKHNDILRGTTYEEPSCKIIYYRSVWTFAPCTVIIALEFIYSSLHLSTVWRVSLSCCDMNWWCSQCHTWLLFPILLVYCKITRQKRFTSRHIQCSICDLKPQTLWDMSMQREKKTEN